MKDKFNMKDKFFYVFTILIALICFGCTYKQNRNENTITDDIQNEIHTNNEYVQKDAIKSDIKDSDADNTDESVIYEDSILEYINAITDDMLDSYNEYPSLESYWNDPIVLLNKFNDDLRLYGITSEEWEAMFLYVQGEKVFICLGFHNLYQELPKLNYFDIDLDGVEEVIISDRTVTGMIRRYELIVCDYESTWNVYTYDDYLQDIDEVIQWQYNEAEKTILILDKEGNVLTELELPEWTDSYPFTGNVVYDDSMSFDAEAMLFYVTPQFGLQNSLPFDPIEIVFNVIYKDGEFELGDYYIRGKE